MYAHMYCTCTLYTVFIRMNLVETHLWQNDDWKDQYVGVVPRATTGNKVNGTFVKPGVRWPQVGACLVS